MSGPDTTGDGCLFTKGGWVVGVMGEHQHHVGLDDLTDRRRVLLGQDSDPLIGFTQSIAKELGGDHINANAIAVPTTQTPMLKETDFDIFVEDELRDIPWGRIGTPEDIADMVLYLASDASEYVTGQVLAPNGGRRTPV